MPMNTQDRNEIIRKQIDQLNLDLKRGFLQFVTIHLIAQRPMYAYEIKEQILNITKGTFDIDRNNLYKKLRLLENDGILESRRERSNQGADRKYYSITSFGRRLYKEMYELLIPVMASLHKTIRSTPGEQTERSGAGGRR
jgi:DNA-binding PadR family transcriptional regulator